MAPLGIFQGNLIRARSRVETVAVVLLAPLLVGLLAVCVQSWPHTAAGLLWSLAALAVGSMIGFLFGVPRVMQGEVRDDPPPGPPPPPGSSARATPATEARYRIQVNTNLEQISDWLTKIIVGLGLINLGRLPDLLVSASRFVGGTFGGAPADQTFAAAILLFFSFMGFAIGYLATRLYLTSAFVAADRAAISPQEFSDEVEREAQHGDPSSQGLPSEAQVAAAERVGKLALSVSEPVILGQVEELALEYERTRSSMRAGPERTRRLDAIVRRMRTLGMAARFLLPDLVRSDSPGKRLVALALLAVTPDREYLSWIADRFLPDAERPFVVYHAAVALAAAARTLEPALVRSELQRAIDLARQLPPDPTRDHALDESARVLEGRVGAAAATTASKSP